MGTQGRVSPLLGLPGSFQSPTLSPPGLDQPPPQEGVASCSWPHIRGITHQLRGHPISLLASRAALRPAGWLPGAPSTKASDMPTELSVNRPNPPGPCSL